MMLNYQFLHFRHGLSTSIIVLIILYFLLFQHSTYAQSNFTPNTLKLDNPNNITKATFQDVNILVGHWQGDFLGAKCEEVWLPPAGGSMVGVFRQFDDDKTFFFELMTIFEEEGSVSLRLKHFNSDLMGWEEKDKSVTFRLVKTSKNTIWFDGLTYSKHEDGTLRGSIAIQQKDGTIEEYSFTLFPVSN